MLVKFIHDLTKDERLQRAFAENPKKVMKQAGLSKQQQTLFTSRNRQQLAHAVVDELNHSPIVGWFLPAISLTGIKPTTGAQGQTLQVTLTGKYFTDPMTADIENNAQVVPITIQSVTGATQEKSVATGSLTLPPDLPAGSYTVRVTSNMDTTDTLSMGFKVTAAKKSVASKAPAAKKGAASKAPAAKKSPARAKTPGK